MNNINLLLLVYFITIVSILLIYLFRKEWELEIKKEREYQKYKEDMLKFLEKRTRK